MNSSEPTEGDEALAREGAHWFGRMRGPDAEAHRAAFEAWLAGGPEQRRAYNRAAEIFMMGRLLVDGEDPVTAPVAEPRRRKALVPALLAVACAAGIGGWLALHTQAPSLEQPAAVALESERRTLSTMQGETRLVRLADGSAVHLGPATTLDIAIDRDGRRLRLLRGQARFEVAHESRPFIVFAGGGSVTARGTIFEVALAGSGKVDVHLLQGAVDVAMPRSRAAQASAVRKLAAGESLSYAVGPDAERDPVAPTSAAPANATIAAHDFEVTPVAELLALANRGASRPIRLSDAGLGGEQVSGRFRIDDTALLAKRLGALFEARVDLSNPKEIVLKR